MCSASNEAADKVRRAARRFRRAGRETARQPAQGVSALTRVIELVPLHEQAFAQLEQIQTDGASWEALVELYLARVEVTEAAGKTAFSSLHKVAKTSRGASSRSRSRRSTHCWWPGATNFHTS